MVGFSDARKKAYLHGNCWQGFVLSRISLPALTGKKRASTLTRTDYAMLAKEKMEVKWQFS